MSNRFYVNEVQIFGNNEMFTNTYEELKKQGAEWTDDGTFDEIEIKDPQALLDAVEMDSLEYLKKCLTNDVWILEEKTYKDKSFCDLTDKDLLLDMDDDKHILNHLYTDDGEVKKGSWKYLRYWKDCMRVFTALNLYEAIKNEVMFLDDKLVLKPNGTIIARMY